MEAAKQAGASASASASASSITLELFGPKDSSKSASLSNDPYGSFFGPSSTGLGKDSALGGITLHYASRSANPKQESSGTGERSGSTGKNPNFVDQNETVEPCYFNSSIFYGGQEVYSTTAQNHNSQNLVPQYRKDAAEDDLNSNTATRGNWWRGSLYY